MKVGLASRLSFKRTFLFFNCDFFSLSSFSLNDFLFLMAYYRRRRFLRRRRYGRRYRRYRRSYARRYVNGSSRSSIRCKCVVTGQSTLHSGHGDTLGADVFRIIPLSLKQATNAVPLVSSPLFQAYQALYEEMKIIGMKVQVSVTDQVGGSTLPSLQIYTSWDRRVGYGEPDQTPAMVKNASSNNVATALNNNVAKLSRSIYASDLIEKAQWIDSSSAAAGGDNQAWVAAALNPNFFHPAFYMCFGSPSLNAGSEVAAVHFSVSVTYYVAFRNPRYGGASSSKELPVKGASLSATDEYRSQVPAGYESLYDFMLASLDYTPEHALARCRARYAEENAPAAAMADGDEDVEGPAELGKRQRSNASQVALVPDAQRPKNA